MLVQASSLWSSAFTPAVPRPLLSLIVSLPLLSPVVLEEQTFLTIVHPICYIVLFMTFSLKLSVVLSECVCARRESGVDGEFK